MVDLFLNTVSGVDMATMLNFKRLASLSEDKEVIKTALKKSSSGLMEVCIVNI